MSAPQATGQEGDTAELTNGPGRRLRVARQAQGLTLDAIASELHLSPSMIESLERDDFEDLPGQVFIVGYIRKYARVVGLDVEPLLAAYHAAVPQATRTWLRPRAKPTNADQVGSGHLVVRLVSVAILISLCGLAFVWWQNRPVEEGVESTEAGTIAEHEITDPTAPGPIPDQPETPPIVSGEVEAPATPRTLDSPRQEPTLATTTSSAAEQQPAAEAQALATVASDADEEPNVPSGNAIAPERSEEPANPEASDAVESEETSETAEILITFDGPCWVDVRDSERKYKLFGEMKKGDRHVLGGTAPYSVILGNAAAARITVGGAAFDLSPVSQGNVARFTLDPSNAPGPPHSDAEPSQ